jgi:hypothetical protein
MIEKMENEFRSLNNLIKMSAKQFYTDFLLTSNFYLL